jgi:hypothetical protein
MQQAIDVIEDVFLGDRLSRIGRLEMGQSNVGDRITSLEVGGLPFEEAAGFFILLVIEIEGEALRIVIRLK